MKQKIMVAKMVATMHKYIESVGRKSVQSLGA